MFTHASACAYLVLALGTRVGLNQASGRVKGARRLMCQMTEVAQKLDLVCQASMLTKVDEHYLIAPSADCTYSNVWSY